MLWALSTRKDDIRPEKQTSICLLLILHKSNYITKFFKTYKISPRTNIKRKHTCMRKHQRQNFKYSIAPIIKAHKARTLWHCRPFRLISQYEIYKGSGGSSSSDSSSSGSRASSPVEVVSPSSSFSIASTTDVLGTVVLWWRLNKLCQFADYQKGNPEPETTKTCRSNTFVTTTLSSNGRSAQRSVVCCRCRSWSCLVHFFLFYNVMVRPSTCPQYGRFRSWDGKVRAGFLVIQRSSCPGSADCRWWC